MFLIRLHSTLCLSYGYSMQLRLYGRRAPKETDPIIPKQTIWYFIFSPYLKPACFPPLVFAEATPSTRNTLKSGVGKRVLKQRQHNQPYHHQHHHQNQQRLPPRRRRFDFSRLAESATSDLEGCQSPDSPASVSPPPTNYTRRQRDDLDHGLGLDFPHHQLSQHQAQMMMRRGNHDEEFREPTSVTDNALWRRRKWRSRQRSTGRPLQACCHVCRERHAPEERDHVLRQQCLVDLDLRGHDGQGEGQKTKKVRSGQMLPSISVFLLSHTLLIFNTHAEKKIYMDCSRYDKK